MTLALAACRPPFAGKSDPLGDAVAMVASDGVDATATTLAAAMQSGDVDFWDAKDRAHELLDLGDANAVDFAAAILEAGRQVESTLPKGNAREFAWWTVGRLAYRAGEVAALSGEYERAESLLLAGPKRWQRESYWRKYADHDALIAVTLANLGRRSEAIRWLDQRPALMPPADEVYERLVGGR